MSGGGLVEGRYPLRREVGGSGHRTSLDGGAGATVQIVEVIARGQKTFDYEPTRGVWQRLEGTEEVLDLMTSGAEGVVAVIRDAGATFLSPIFDELAGVVCTGGTIRSHIGIISREFRVPGVVAAEITDEPTTGACVELDGTGEVGIVRVVGGS